MGGKRKQPHEGPLCGARKKTGPKKGEPCEKTAGWGTDHPGSGKCRLHGGASAGAPERNKNALTTGERETIWTDVLDDGEQAILDRKLDKVKLLEEEIGLLTIRERRMLGRIKALNDTESGMTVVEEVAEFSADGPAKQKAKRIGTLGQIQRIEEALTRVQTAKAKAIALKHQLEMDIGGGDAEHTRPTINVTAPKGRTL